MREAEICKLSGTCFKTEREAETVRSIGERELAIDEHVIGIRFCFSYDLGVWKSFVIP